MGSNEGPGYNRKGGTGLLNVRHESASLLVAESATEKVLTQHISYPALGLS